MDKPAIQQIQVTANIPALIKQLETDIPMAMVPDSMRLESLEDKMEHRSRYRMNFDTENIKDFCRYNESFDQAGARCFIDPNQMSANTIFDLGSTEFPLHKQNTANITLKKSALFSAISKLSSYRMTQSDAAEFLEEWCDDNVQIINNAGDGMTWQAAAKSLRDLTIEAAREVNSKVSDLGQSMSQMEKIEAKNQSSIPAFITFNCAPYPHMKERGFKLRISILTSDKPLIIFKIMQLETMQEEIAIEFKEILTDSFEALYIESFIGNSSN